MFLQFYQNGTKKGLIKASNEMGMRALPLGKFPHTNTHTHTHIYIYIVGAKIDNPHFISKILILNPFHISYSLQAQVLKNEAIMEQVITGNDEQM